MAKKGQKFRKFTNEEREEIVSKYLSGKYSYEQVAKEYFKLLIVIILSIVNPLSTPPSYMACVSGY